jgi:hypothetical protein
MVTIKIEIGRDFQELGDNDGSTGTIGLEVADISVEELLVDPLETDTTDLVTRELEKAACAIERLPDAARGKLLAVTRDVDVEPDIEKLAQRLADTHIRD